MQTQTLNQLSSGPSSQPRITFRIAIVWLILAALVTIGVYIKHRTVSLDGDYNGWASASCMIMARAFTQLGIWQTHLVPFQNNLPVGNDPDVYLHWPPLYPVVLSVFVRLFGDSASSGRLLELVIILASALFVFLIARQLYAPRVGILAAFFFLTTAITFTAGFAILQQPLSLLFALISVYCFLHAIPDGFLERMKLSSRNPSSSLPYSVRLRPHSLSSPHGTPSSFPLVCSLQHSISVIAKPYGLLAFYCLTAVGTFIGVQVLYILSYPKLFANQLATIAYRAGLQFHGEHGVRLATIVDVVHYDEHFNLATAFWHVLRNIEKLLPSIVVVACLLFAAIWWQNGKRSDRSATWAIGSLLLPVVVWFVVMNNYVAIHSFPLILAAPFVALAAGFVLDLLWKRYSVLPTDGHILWTLLLGVPFVAILPLLAEYRDASVIVKPEFASLSAIIRDGTPAGAVVLTPEPSLVPVYYSQRHVIRGTNSDTWLSWAIPEARKQFPGAPLYLAMRDSDAQNFHSGFQLVAQDRQLGDSTLYRVLPGTPSPEAGPLQNDTDSRRRAALEVRSSKSP